MDNLSNLLPPPNDADILLRDLNITSDLPYSEGNFSSNFQSATFEGNSSEGKGWSLSKTAFMLNKHNPNTREISNFSYNLDYGKNFDGSDSNDGYKEILSKIIKKVEW